ncbi:TPA: serine O-acetyltransferase [Photobacterium damselae]
MLFKLYLIGFFFHKNRFYFLSKLIYIIQFFLFNSSLPHTTVIGKKTKFAYGGIGIVIHARAKIGNNCIIGQGCTIGGRSRLYDVPQIGNNVYIGAGARILGPIKIEDNCIIAPNAVVINNVYKNSIVAGVPAKIIRENINPEDFI